MNVKSEIIFQNGMWARRLASCSSARWPPTRFGGKAFIAASIYRKDYQLINFTKNFAIQTLLNTTVQQKIYDGETEKSEKISRGFWNCSRTCPAYIRRVDSSDDRNTREKHYSGSSASVEIVNNM